MQDTRNMVEALKLEIDMIRGGRYNPPAGCPAGSPAALPRVIRDSVTCPNVALDDDHKEVPCDQCFLHPFLPEGHHRDLACYDIPLNAHGDTLANLANTGDTERTQQVLLGWLEKTVKDLQANAASLP